MQVQAYMYMCMCVHRRSVICMYGRFREIAKQIRNWLIELLIPVVCQPGQIYPDNSNRHLCVKSYFYIDVMKGLLISIKFSSYERRFIFEKVLIED